ncbi:LacI family transcriptional regulator [Paenibacillus cellulosilyticus]|uniref:LacI family transcriptional regulator n=1 Tax=Paenibacillus cellulosilyticus TaxID=375489 RepID=A0A2V2YTF7_9BACL|nr:LacI family DNA-binding transcriptional regulator [Paenibacillus cellulosilyticus]PWW01116.1 LacI family transcriptional regulator [Paenibacillus cellulosilyticus]QKS46915.1 LacI family DNA-binding transcriptional regulator [Paenibacillus cellulosilyticus]
MNKVGIKEIAAKANVSTATVSYVLNGTRNVRPKTRERVVKVIEELNYRPNDIAKSLKSRRTNTIGVIAEDVTVFNVPEIIDGINEFADKHDLHIILTNLRLHRRVGHNYSNVDAYRKYAESAVSDLLSKQVEGIIYIGVHPRDVTGLINTYGKPIVYTYCYTDQNVSIQYNDEQASFDAMQYLVKQGHKRIAIISGLMDSTPSRLRFNGYYKAVTEFQLPFNPQYIKIGDWGLDSGYRLTKELLTLSEPPTAVLVMNDVMAVGTLRAADECGCQIPRDLSVVGFDNREFSDYLNPRITTMDLPLHEMGYSSMSMLTGLINEKEVKQEEQPLCRLLERESVAPPRQE